MTEQLKRFAEEFFRNLKCEVSWVDEVLKVENVPKSFEDLLGKAAPYDLTFVDGVAGDFVSKGSKMLVAMREFLKGSGKTTLLKINFDVDPEAEIRKRVGFSNCEIESLTEKHKNSFFSRFSFVTSFNYLNSVERVSSEIYVHKGKVVEGDLDGYTVVDGSLLTIDKEQVKRDYIIARNKVAQLISSKQDEIAEVLKEKVEVEIERIREHYDKALKERGNDLNGKLEKIRDVELELRGGGNGSALRSRLERLRSSLVKAGDDEVVSRIEKEREMTVRDVMHKFSLNVDRKLVNTTVIYYPVYSFRLCLNGDRAHSFIDVEYDPLIRKFSGLDCGVCKKMLDRVSLCEGGHIVCSECLDRCGECGGVFCAKCLQRSCKVCGRRLCKNCVKMCLGCGGVVCSTHLRRDCVSGEDRCTSCLRACLRCHGMCEERYFGEALDGSKVCQRCLGVENRDRALGKVFSR